MSWWEESSPAYRAMLDEMRQRDEDRRILEMVVLAALELGTRFGGWV